MPVKLEQGAYYRLGINSTSYQNFRSRGRDGVPVASSAIYFATKGATADVASRVRVPKVKLMEPATGATDVDPKVEVLRVSFDVPMGDGMSWTGNGPNYPPSPQGKQASWSKDGLACTLPVALEPAHDYELELNGFGHNNFQSQWGVPLAPVIYRFRTRDK